MADDILVSIIVNNYNYGRFLREAIDSALSQTFQPIEVIVVDDGSTDDSAQIIAKYGDRIKAILKQNEGQPSAINAGFEHSQGEIVIFLDADDSLLPQAVQEVVESFRSTPGAARVQYRMEIMDAQGKSTGELKPAAGISAASGDLQQQTLAFPFDLRWLPTSGNAFSARALREILPMPALRYGRTGADWYLIPLASLYGSVCFLDETLACYRVHESNSFDIPENAITLDHIRESIRYMRLTDECLQQAAHWLGLRLPRDEITSVVELADRIISWKSDPSGHPVEGDSTWKLLRLGIIASLGRYDVSFSKRLVFLGWFLVMALAPARACPWMAQFFFNPQTRGVLNRLPGVRAA